MPPLETISTHLQDQPPRRTAFLVAGILLIAANLRPTLTGVGPLLGSIRIDVGLTDAAVGFLNTLFLLAFAGVSLVVPAVGR